MGMCVHLDNFTDFWDCTLDLAPGIGNVKGGAQAIFGENLVTGEELSTSERIWESVSALPFGNWIKKGRKLLGFGKKSKGTGHANESPALKDNPYKPNSVAKRNKPDYRANPAHDGRNPNKTLEPSDAQSVYTNNSVRGGMGTWYGVGKDGNIYQYFSDNAGGVHFAGTISKEKLLNDIRKQLGVVY